MKKFILLAVLLFPVNAFAWTVSWQDNSTNEDGFRVYRKIPGEANFSVIATLGVDVVQYVDAGASLAGTCYKVSAFNDAGEGISDTVCASIPAKPKITSIKR